MFAVTAHELTQAIDGFFWPFLRIGAMWMVLPVFGSGTVPSRIRIILAAVTTLLVLPLLPPPPAWPVFSGAWFLGVIQQLALGATMGFVLQFVFEAVLLGGQMVALAMGLGFAEMSDPLRGVSSPVVSQYFSMVASLLFLAAGGHLLVFQWVVVSFQSLPVDGPGLAFVDLWALLSWSSLIFVGAIKIALPATIALLLVNLSFGVISRSAPSLNLLAIGFPAALLFGMVMLNLTMPVLAQAFAGMLSETWSFFETWVGL